MTFTTPTPPRDAVRDLFAVLLIVLGTVGVVTCAFLAHELAGWALVSGLVVAVGVSLGYRR